MSNNLEKDKIMSELGTILECLETLSPANLVADIAAIKNIVETDIVAMKQVLETTVSNAVAEIQSINLAQVVQDLLTFKTTVDADVVEIKQIVDTVAVDVAAISAAYVALMAEIQLIKAALVIVPIVAANKED